MEASGVGGPRTAQKYEESDFDALKGREKESTSAAINRIGRHAGLTQNYAVRGDDKSEREIKAAHHGEQAHEGSAELAKTGGKELATHVAELLAEKSIEHAADLSARAAGGLLLMPVELVVFGYEMAKGVAEDGKVGQERARAIPTDVMHAACVASLNGLPQAFVDSELARYPDSLKNGTLARTMNDRLANDVDRRAMIVLQLHCDQGMNAARGMCDAKLEKDGFLRSNPDVAKRCTEDMAFKAGFDALVWAHGKGAESYGAVVKDLEARDARYQQHSVAWRA